MSRGARGFTLTEVLVSMAVMAILTLVLLRLASVAYRIGREEIERSSAESSLMLACRRLEEDLLETAPAGVSLNVAGNVLVTHPLGQVLSSGRVTYQDRLVHWSWSAAEKALARQEVLTPPSPLLFDGSPLRLTTAQLDALPVTAAGGRTLLRLEAVSAFAVSNPADVSVPDIGSPLSVTVKVELPLARTHKELELNKIFRLRTANAF